MHMPMQKDGSQNMHVRVYGGDDDDDSKTISCLAKPADRVRYSVDAFDTHMELAPNGKCQLETK
jgi:hypothetical protein